MITHLKWKQLFIMISLLALNYELNASLVKKTKYKTKFNNCPSQSAGKFAMKVLKKFDETNSLYDVKSEIQGSFLQGKYFIKDYAISYEPVAKSIHISLTCPRPLLRVVLMDNEASQELQSILVDDGELYDPTYETLLLGEKKIKNQLPTLAIHKENLNKETRLDVVSILENLGVNYHSKISEVIFDNERSVTMILSLNKYPVSVFFGSGELSMKSEKLKRLLRYVEKNNKQPKVINLVNLKKVVVKFAHKK